MNGDQDWLDSQYQPDLVAIIIPTYNRAALLGLTLNSIVEQSYRPIEIQLVDDGSTDNTQDIVSEFIMRHCDKNLTLQYHRRDHQGASAARNYGLQKSSGEFIQFLDSDDVLHPEKVSVQTQALKMKQADFVWSSTIAYTGEPDWSAPIMVGAEMDIDHALEAIKPFIQKSCWRTESGLHRRSNCINTGPWKTLTMFQDWEYHIRMLTREPKIQFVGGKFAAANQHAHGRIGDKWLDGSGLEGALSAIQLVEGSTRPLFSTDSDWQALLKRRFVEVAERAEKLSLLEVAERARGITNELPY